MNRRRRNLLLAAVLMLGAACSTEPVAVRAPEPGILTLRFTTPHSDDGALLFELRGPAIGTATATGGGLQLFTRSADATTLVGAVVGNLATGGIVRFPVPDVATVQDYTVRLIEVADRQNLLRAGLANYALEVLR